ncbi:MAG: hypothetical protein ACI9UU_001615 [Candidatus Azotimanducaceae bacterium]|jgi:hypothetical protein
MNVHYRLPAVMFARAYHGGYGPDSGHSCVRAFGKRMPGFGQLRSLAKIGKLIR